jgi:hypothetical protein
MTIRAERDPRFYFRFLLIGLGALAFALWALYDGAVKYPRQRERGLAFEKLMDEDRGDEWDAYALERDWPTEFPGEPKSEVDIQMQYWMAGGSALVAFFPLWAVWSSRGRWIEWDGNQLTSSWGQSLSPDQVVSLEKRQWRSKGIAKLKYLDGNRKRTFVIDDFKFKREPTDKILAELENHIDHEKITGGPPEGYEQVIAEATAMATDG